MNFSQNINLNITHNQDYKILNVTIKNKITNNDVHTTIIMIQNFFDNCKQNNIKFSWVWDLKELQEIPIIALEVFSKFCKTNYPTIKEHLICSCLVSNEGLFKKFFGLFTKLYEPTKPLKNFLNVEECQDFIKDCVNEKYKNDTIIY